MISALNGAIVSAAQDPDVRVILISGAGPAFSAGHDLKEIDAHRADGDGGKAFYERLMGDCAILMQNIQKAPQPVIAVIETIATAAGCQLVAACDLAIAGAEARFALPGVAVGLFCSSPLVSVGRAVSRKHAMEMALSGELYDAADAERFGLVNRVVPAGEAETEARKFAAGIAARSAPILALGKRAFYEQIEQPLAEAYAVGAKAMVDNLALRDSAEGIGAFIAKRAPRWG